MADIKLAIVDDHKIFREGLKSTLEDYSHIKLLIESSTGEQILEQLEKEVPDVILMDIKMPNMDGIEATELINKKYRKVKVLALSMYDDDKYILNMMRAGARGYLLKSSDPDEIAEAISTVHERGYYFNDHLSMTMVKKLMGNTPLDGHEKEDAVELNDREHDILKLICHEYANTEIADKLCLSVRTVEGYRTKLFEKTGARNIAGLVIFAIKNRIIQI